MRRRGSSLVATLLLLALLLLLGMSMLHKSAAVVAEAELTIDAAEARQLAMAGLADAQGKLWRDLEFPPQAAASDSLFSYTEEVHDLDGVTLLGSYTVTIDGRYLDLFQIYRVRSEGILVDGTKRYLVEAELDAAAEVRGTSNPNPNFWKWVYWRE